MHISKFYCTPPSTTTIPYLFHKKGGVGRAWLVVGWWPPGGGMQLTFEIHPLFSLSLSFHHVFYFTFDLCRYSQTHTKKWFTGGLNFAETSFVDHLSGSALPEWSTNQCPTLAIPPKKMPQKLTSCPKQRLTVQVLCTKGGEQDIKHVQMLAKKAVTESVVCLWLVMAWSEFLFLLFFFLGQRTFLKFYYSIYKPSRCNPCLKRISPTWPWLLPNLEKETT